MLTTTRPTRYGAAAAAALVAAGTLAGAGTASADPEVTSPDAPAAAPYAMPIVNIGDPWSLGQVPLYYGNGPVCAGYGEGQARSEEVHITFSDARNKTPLFSLDPLVMLPSSMILDVEWHNNDTGASGTDHAVGYHYDGFSRPKTGPGRITGTVKATASILPSGGSVEGIGSHSLTMPFETTVPPCPK